MEDYIEYLCGPDYSEDGNQEYKDRIYIVACELAYGADCFVELDKIRIQQETIADTLSKADLLMEYAVLVSSAAKGNCVGRMEELEKLLSE